MGGHLIWCVYSTSLESPALYGNGLTWNDVYL